MSIEIRRLRLTQSLERLVKLYTTWEKPEQAGEWRKKLAELEVELKSNQTEAATPTK